MLKPFRNLFRKAPAAPRPSVPEGTRYYAIGDIHGCYDLFEALIEAIEEDDAKAPAADTTIILLGDLIDRGKQSAEVVARARDWGKQRKVRYLAGNHEQMFLDSLDDLKVLRQFLKHGGRETILSYGITRRDYNKLSLEELQKRVRKAVPRKHREFLAGFEELIIAGDYAFVHAGVEPTRTLDDQTRQDLLWIRGRFLGHDSPFEKVIVHGHTIFETVEHRPHRIGVDTGAFRFGRLTALVLEGETQRFIQARQTSDDEAGEGSVSIEKWGDET